MCKTGFQTDSLSWCFNHWRKTLNLDSKLSRTTPVVVDKDVYPREHTFSTWLLSVYFFSELLSSFWSNANYEDETLRPLSAILHSAGCWSKIKRRDVASIRLFKDVKNSLKKKLFWEKDCVLCTFGRIVYCVSSKTRSSSISNTICDD